ncbi:MAG TPA: restriction endonuclease subunit S [Candidatus Vogelbacteria bacterium]|nr:restriction endonuclease subunit S [Candidatus Vogelbacteria bacterium]
MKINQKVKLGDICTIRTGKLDSNAAIEGGKYPFFTCAQETFSIDKFVFDTEAVLLGGNNANGIFPLKYYQGKFNAYQRTYVIESKDGNKALNKFIYFSLRPFLDYFKSASIGAATQYLTKPVLDNLKINLPDIDTQRSIIDIVYAYDDLIDTNRRRIQLLEEAARLLFREWFVYFRFPGHEKVKIVDRDGRKMPSDWDYLPFTKIKIFKKAPLGVPVFTDIRQYYQTSEIDSTTITGDGKEVDYENRPSRADIAPRINTVYFAKMKDTDKVLYFNKGNSFLLEKILLSTGMVGFTTDEKYLGFLFGLLKSYEFVQYKNNFATGATQVSLNNASLKKIKVLFPKLNLVELYSEIVNPLLEKCSLLRNQNQKLVQARDLLLPRLMSGEIKV